MGSAGSPALLKALSPYLRASFILRLVSLPAAVLALHLELHGSSPATASLILHRLLTRLRLSSLVCLLRDPDDDSIIHGLYLGSVSKVRPAKKSRTTRRAKSMSPATRQSQRSSRVHSPAASSPSAVSSHLPTPSLPQLPQQQQQQQQQSQPSQPPLLQHYQQKQQQQRQPLPPLYFPSLPNSPLPFQPSSGFFASPSPLPRMPSTTTPRLHQRSVSYSDATPRSGKRRSLQFPIQPSTGPSTPGFRPSMRARPQSFAAPSPMPSPLTPSIGEEPNLLAIVAHQERHVLELKEELAKAEADLENLKKHFARQEIVKQRESLKATPLQPIKTTLIDLGPEPEDQDGSAMWLQKEMERRKALLTSTKTSQRKVLSGSRHLRALSLLSPDKQYTPSFPQPLDLQQEPATPATPATPASERVGAPPRQSISSDMSGQTAVSNMDRFELVPAVQREALLRTGKQMATDLKDGLLTFIEDIRQATVGDEAATPGDKSTPTLKGQAAKVVRKPDTRPPLKRAQSAKGTSTPKSDFDADDFWKAHGVTETKAATANVKTQVSKGARTPLKPAQATATKQDEFEDWDNWDTPNDKPEARPVELLNSSDESDVPSSPVSGQTSSRTSYSLSDDAILRDPNRNSIPWPDLVKLSPGNLKRTASHLMKEWEKNLTPPPESRNTTHASGDYIGRDVSPATPRPS